MLSRWPLIPGGWLQNCADRTKYQAGENGGGGHGDKPGANDGHDMAAPDQFPLPRFRPAVNLEVGLGAKVCGRRRRDHRDAEASIGDEFAQKADAKDRADSDMR